MVSVTLGLNIAVYQKQFVRTPLLKTFGNMHANVILELQQIQLLF